MTNYMFDPVHNSDPKPRHLRCSAAGCRSLLAWLVWRLGYDRRALLAWTAVAWALCVLCYNFFPGPPAPGEVASDPSIPVNINFVFGPSDKAAQTWMAPLPYLALYMAALFVVFFLPTHLVLRYVVRQASPVPVSTTA